MSLIASPRPIHVAVAFAALAVAGPGSAETLRLNHNLPEETVTGQAFNFFAERVDDLTDGDLRIRVFHAAQLGNQRESMELVQQGALDMAKTNTAEMEAFEPLYGVFNLPYIFQSDEHIAQVLKGEIGQQVLDASTDKGFVGIGFLFEGSRSFYTVKEACSMADLAGRKIRVQPSPSAIRMVELMGAQPTPIDFGELYSALQQGVVDGAENNVSALTDIRHGEVAKWYMNNEHTTIPAVYVISTGAWNALSDDHQAALRQAASETFDFQLESWLAREAEWIRIATEDLGVTFCDPDRAPFIEAVSPMIDEASAANPQVGELVTAIQSLGQ